MSFHQTFPLIITNATIKELVNLELRKIEIPLYTWYAFNLGNESGVPGKRGYWSFDLECTTVDALNTGKVFKKGSEDSFLKLSANDIKSDDFQIRLSDFKQWKEQMNDSMDLHFSNVLKAEVLSRCLWLQYNIQRCDCSLGQSPGHLSGSCSCAEN